MQTKKLSLIETITNTFLGLVISIILGYYVFPIYGMEKKITYSIQITIIFTLASIIRSYTVRRIFNR